MRKAVELFGEAMEEVLKENDSKKVGWGPGPCTLDFLKKKIVIEVGEFFETENPKELLDIANYCMMVWSRTLRIGEYK